MASEMAEKTTPNKDKSKTFILLVLVIITLLAGTFTYLNLGIKNSSAQEATHKDMKSVTLPSLTVNLAEGNRVRYLKTTITLEYPASKELDEELGEGLYKVKDSILKVLRNTNAAFLNNPQETEFLKQELLKEVNAELKSGEVTGLYFEEFIVQ